MRTAGARRIPPLEGRRAGVEGPAAPWLAPPVLVALLAATGVLVLAHRAWERGVLDDRRFALWYDGSYGELLAYGMAGASAALLLRTWLARSEPVDLAWALTFLLIGLDDALRIHERAGGALVDALGVPAVAGFRAQDLGELGTWAAMGAAVATGLLVTHRASGRDARRDSRRLLVFLLLLVAASGVGDMGAQLLEGTGAERPLAFVDDGGELVVLSAIVAAAVATAQRELALSRA